MDASVVDRGTFKSWSLGRSPSWVIGVLEDQITIGESNQPPKTRTGGAGAGWTKYEKDAWVDRMTPNGASTNLFIRENSPRGGFS